MILATIDAIPGKTLEALGLVQGTIVQSKDYFHDWFSGLKTLVGGELDSYTDMIEEARSIATKRMVDEAEELGADAIVGVRYGSSSVMDGAAEIIAYGTAVKFKRRQTKSVSADE